MHAGVFAETLHLAPLTCGTVPETRPVPHPYMPIYGVMGQVLTYAQILALSGLQVPLHLRRNMTVSKKGTAKT